jgi:hypothetical protein
MHSTCPVYLILHDSALVMFKEVTGRGPPVQDHFFTHEDGSGTAYLIISHQLPTYAAQHRRRAKISTMPRQKPEMSRSNPKVMKLDT